MAKKATDDGNNPANTVAENNSETSLGKGQIISGNEGSNVEAETPSQSGGNNNSDDDVRAALERANAAISRLDEYEGTRAGYEKRLNDAQSAIDEFRTELVAWKDQLSAREKTETETRETIATLQTELAAMRDSLTKLQANIPIPMTSQSQEVGSTSHSQTVREVTQQATASLQASTQAQANQSGEEGEQGQKSKPQVEPQPAKRKRVFV